MNGREIMKSFEEYFKKNNLFFFDYALKDNLKNYFEYDSKYQALLEWIDRELRSEQITQNIINPAIKEDGYTNGDLERFKEASMNVAMLLSFRNLLVDSTTTTTIRDNIEYSICKIYNIEYKKEFNGYI